MISSGSPRARLEQLIEKWRVEASRWPPQDDVFEQCADELEAAIAAREATPVNGRLEQLAQELVDRYTKAQPVAERHGGCGWCGGLPHSTECLVGRFEAALGEREAVPSLPQPDYRGAFAQRPTSHG